VIEVREVPKPEPQAGDVLVKLQATTVCRTDCGQLRAHPFFMRLVTGVVRPTRTILGTDRAGEVEAIGERVTSFVPGDRVFGLTPGATAAMPSTCVCHRTRHSR
jgi:NADPH:quinone reductase-like Zn-dependent oxidoreductase